MQHTTYPYLSSTLPKEITMHGCRKRMQTAQSSSGFQTEKKGVRNWRDSEADWGEAGGNKDGSEKVMGKVRDEGTREQKKTRNMDKG